MTTTPCRPARRRRLLLVAAALLAAIEVSGLTVTSAVLARSALEQRSADVTAPEAARQVSEDVLGIDSESPGHRPAAASVRLAAEFPPLLAPAPATRRLLTDDQAFERAAPAQTMAPSPVAVTSGAATQGTTPRPAAPARTAVSTPLRLRMPDLGISQTTRDYPCSRSEPPANYVYRWGCAGKNNLYLLGHAYSVFKPLHDAYASGRLRVGMVAYWTDAAGRTVTYRVSSWRVVKPTDASWAIASQPVPSMTLQTCYGPNSEYRLLVRLVAA